MLFFHADNFLSKHRVKKAEIQIGKERGRFPCLEAIVVRFHLHFNHEGRETSSKTEFVHTERNASSRKSHKLLDRRGKKPQILPLTIKSALYA